MVYVVPHCMWFWPPFKMAIKSGTESLSNVGKGCDESNVPKSCSQRKHPHQISCTPVRVCAGVYEFKSNISVTHVNKGVFRQKHTWKGSIY